MGCCGKVDDKTQPEPKSLKKRFCTDLLCLLIFIVFTGLQAGICGFGIYVGDWAALLYEQDYLGNRCGTGTCGGQPCGTKAFYPRIPTDMMEEENRPYVESGDFFSISLYALCVDECPQTFNIKNPGNSMKFDYGYDPTSAVTQALGEGTQQYWLSATPTLDILNRCIPMEESSSDEDEVCAYPNCTDTSVVAAGGLCSTDVEYTNGEWTMCPSSGSGVVEDAVCATQKDTCKVKATTTTGVSYAMNADDEASEALLGQVASLVGGFYEIMMAIVDAATYIFLGGIVVPVLLAFVYMMFLFLFAKTVIYGLLLACVLSELVGTFVLFSKSGISFQGYDAATLLEMATDAANVSVSSDEASELLEVVDEDSQWMYSLGFLVMGVFTVLTIIFILLSRKKIAICAAIIKEATTVFATMPSLMIFPSFAIVFQIIVCVWFIGTMILIYTTKPESLDVALGIVANASYVQAAFGVTTDTLAIPSVDPIAELRTLAENDQAIFYLSWVVLFGFLVFIQFVQGVSWCTMSATVYYWYYFRKNPAEKTKIPILRSLGRNIFFHTGSIAFAAFIIALCDLARAIAYYVEKQMEAAGAKKGMAIKLAFKALHCCLACLKKTVKFVSYYGLIWVACTGCNFCSGCFKTFFFFLQNPSQVALNSLVTMLLKLVALFSMPLVCGVAFYYLLDTVLESEHAMYPAAIITVCAMVMTVACMTVFDCTVTTIFVCCFQDKAEFKAKYMMKDHKRLATAFGIKPDAAVMGEGDDKKEEGKDAKKDEKKDEKKEETQKM
jgi:choline transporter-like protein 2/4/5